MSKRLKTDHVFIKEESGAVQIKEKPQKVEQKVIYYGTYRHLCAFFALICINCCLWITFLNSFYW